MTERREFPPLREDDLDADPFVQFARWYDLAREQVPLADAMTLATVGEDGAPDARMVLLKGLADGFRFFTNLESAKAGQIAADPRGALVVYWREHDRQVRARGAIERLSAADSDVYFASRPPESRLGAWASRQSQPVESRAALVEAVAASARRFGIPYAGPGSPEPADVSVDVPRPPQWGGFRLNAAAVELWVEGEFRIHDRARWTRQAATAADPDGGTAWSVTRLQP